MTDTNKHEIIPCELVNLVNQSVAYGKQAKQIELLLYQGKFNNTTNSMEVQQFYEGLEDRYRKIQKNTRSNAQECLTVLQHNTTTLTAIQTELESDTSTWQYWDDVCPICLQRIRIDNTINLQTTPCCRKLFHSECIRRHLRDSETCPCCRYHDLSGHPLYGYFKGKTPDGARDNFDQITANELRNNFTDTSSHQFRSIFNEWSYRNQLYQQGIYQQQLLKLQQEIAVLKESASK